jgi:hypothetical protein
MSDLNVLLEKQGDQLTEASAATAAADDHVAAAVPELREVPCCLVAAACQDVH